MNTTFTKPIMKNGLALLIQQKNDAQKKLVADVPAMLNSLSLMIEKNIGNESTQSICISFGEGYVKYGRLTDRQLVTLKNIILQYASEIINSLAGESETSETSNEETHTDEEENPFAQ
jgi:hypothetical protein